MLSSSCKCIKRVSLLFLDWFLFLVVLARYLLCSCVQLLKIATSCVRLAKSSAKFLLSVLILLLTSLWDFEYCYCAFDFSAHVQRLFTADFFFLRTCNFAIISGEIQYLWCIFCLPNVYSQVLIHIFSACCHSVSRSRSLALLLKIL